MIFYWDSFGLILRKICVNYSDLGVLNRVASVLISAVQGGEDRDVGEGPMQLLLRQENWGKGIYEDVPVSRCWAAWSKNS